MDPTLWMDVFRLHKGKKHFPEQTKSSDLWEGAHTLQQPVIRNDHAASKPGAITTLPQDGKVKPSSHDVSIPIKAVQPYSSHQRSRNGDLPPFDTVEDEKCRYSGAKNNSSTKASQGRQAAFVRPSAAGATSGAPPALETRRFLKPRSPITKSPKPWMPPVHPVLASDELSTSMNSKSVRSSTPTVATYARHKVPKSVSIPIEPWIDRKREKKARTKSENVAPPTTQVNQAGRNLLPKELWDKLELDKKEFPPIRSFVQRCRKYFCEDKGFVDEPVQIVTPELRRNRDTVQASAEVHADNVTASKQRTIDVLENASQCAGDSVRAQSIIDDRMQNAASLPKSIESETKKDDRESLSREDFDLPETFQVFRDSKRSASSMSVTNEASMLHEGELSDLKLSEFESDYQSDGYDMQVLEASAGELSTPLRDTWTASQNIISTSSLLNQLEQRDVSVRALWRDTLNPDSHSSIDEPEMMMTSNIFQDDMNNSQSAEQSASEKLKPDMNNSQSAQRSASEKTKSNNKETHRSPKSSVSNVRVEEHVSSLQHHSDNAEDFSGVNKSVVADLADVDSDTNSRSCVLRTRAITGIRVGQSTWLYCQIRHPTIGIQKSDIIAPEKWHQTEEDASVCGYTWALADQNKIEIPVQYLKQHSKVTIELKRWSHREEHDVTIASGICDTKDLMRCDTPQHIWVTLFDEHSSNVVAQVELVFICLLQQ